jgi:hypothetical protein
MLSIEYKTIYCQAGTLQLYMACITDNTGQYIVDYTFANAVTNRFIFLWRRGGCQFLIHDFCVANITDYYYVTNIVNPPSLRFTYWYCWEVLSAQ